MSKPSKFLSDFEFSTPVMQYFPAVFKVLKSVGPVIEYYIYDSNTGRYKRNVIKLTRIAKRFTKKSDFRTYAANICTSLNLRLAAAYPPEMPGMPDIPTKSTVNINPTKAVPEDFTTADKTTLDNAVSDFIAEKSKELRIDSLRSYKSVMNILAQWCRDSGIEYLESIDIKTAVAFMNHVYNERQVSAKSYNNYLKLCRAFLSWCVDMQLITDNPFQKIKKKRTEDKKRVPIPRTERTRLIKLADKECPNFIAVCMLIYGSLIRPNELSQLRIKHVHLDEHYITVPSEIAKNHNERCVALSPELECRLRDMHLERYPVNYYLFGSHLEPSKCRSGHRCYKKKFDKLRDTLEWPKEYTLYSFRDTGISEMLSAGIPSIEVMKHADHSSLDITTVYAKHKDENLIRKIYTKCPEF